MGILELLGWIFIGIIAAIVASVGLLWVFGIVRFREIKSGTAVAFELFSEFIYAAMTQSGLSFDPDGFIEEKEHGPRSYRKRNSEGTLRGLWCIWRVGNIVIFLWPFIKTVDYGQHNDDDGFGKGDVIFLHDLQKEFTNLEAETKTDVNGSGATVAVKPKWMYRMMVGQIELFLYRTPKCVVNDVSKVLEGDSRFVIRKHTPNQLQELKGDGTKIWKEFCPPGSPCDYDIEKVLKRRWGVTIMENSIDILDLGYSAKIQESLELKANATLKAEADTEATTVYMNGLMASQLGFADIAAFKAKVAADPTFVDTPKYKEAMEYAKDMGKRKHAAENGELSDMRVGGTDGSKFEGNILFTGGPKKGK